MIKGSKADVIIRVLNEIPLKIMTKVQEGILDMARYSRLISQKSFLDAVLVIERFQFINCPSRKLSLINSTSIIGVLSFGFYIFLYLIVFQTFFKIIFS